MVEFKQASHRLNGRLRFVKPVRHAKQPTLSNYQRFKQFVLASYLKVTSSKRMMINSFTVIIISTLCVQQCTLQINEFNKREVNIYAYIAKL